MSDLLWQKSSFSGSDAGQECVEVASGSVAGTVLLRESDAPGTVLRITAGALRGLVMAASAGALDCGPQ